MDVCIKNIAEEDWSAFKKESLLHSTRLGSLFGQLVHEHENSCTTGNWKKVLFGRKAASMLTLEEAQRIRTEFRKNFRLRE